MTTSLACLRFWATYGTVHTASPGSYDGLVFSLPLNSKVESAYLYSKTNVGTVRVSVRAVDGDYLPIGDDLGSPKTVDLSVSENIGTETYPCYVVLVEFSSPITLAAGNYALIAYSISDDVTWWLTFRRYTTTGISACQKNIIKGVLDSSDGTTWTRNPYFWWVYEVLGLSLATVTTNAATLVTGVSATLNGTLTNDGGEACDCGFEWGLTDAYGNTTPTQSRTTGQTFSQDIIDLSPRKTYHFRAKAVNSVGTAYGADLTFTTGSGYFAWII